MNTVLKFKKTKIFSVSLTVGFSLVFIVMFYFFRPSSEITLGDSANTVKLQYGKPDMVILNQTSPTIDLWFEVRKSSLDNDVTSVKNPHYSYAYFSGIANDYTRLFLFDEDELLIGYFEGGT